MLLAHIDVAAAAVKRVEFAAYRTGRGANDAKATAAIRVASLIGCRALPPASPPAVCAVLRAR